MYKTPNTLPVQIRVQDILEAMVASLPHEGIEPKCSA